MHVIIFGDDGYNTLGVIRSLGKENVEFFLLLVSKKKLNYTLYSRYTTAFEIVRNEQEGIDFLLSNKTFENSTIIPTSDSSVALLDSNYSLLKVKYIFPNAGEDNVINKLMDKSVMNSYASKAGLNIPATFNYSKGDMFPPNINYPIIIKPSKSILGSKKDISICNNKKELIDSINKSHNTQDFLIQQYIDKDFEILLIGASLKINNKVIVPGVFKKLRWYLEGDDASMGVITTDVEQFIDIDNIIEFVNSLEYYGPFSIEFGVMDGIPYFYEINMRNDGTSHYFNKANINIPYLWVLDSYSFDIVDYCDFNDEDYYFIDELGDYLNIATNNTSIKQWYKDLRSAEVYKYFNRNDLKPFFLVLPKMFLLSVYKVIKLIFKDL